MNNRISPLISVVMGCYNSAEYIREAIDSILNQTVSDFEFIIIDDCSRDETIEIINSYDDPRIILVQNETNKGLGYGLNLGVTMSRGKYIARMDADDVAKPYRFEREIEYLESHPQVLIVGSYVRLLGLQSKYARLFYSIGKKPVDSRAIRVLTLVGAAFYHPSVMFNGVLMRERGYNYNASFSKAQDFELWSRIVWDNEVYNIPKALLYYRQSPKQASVLSRNEQLKNSEIIIKRVISDVLNLPVNDNIIHQYRKLITADSLTPNEFAELWAFIKLLREKIIQNSDKFDGQFFSSFFDSRLIDYCRLNLKVSKRFPFYLRHALCKKSLLGFIKLYKNY